MRSRRVAGLAGLATTALVVVLSLTVLGGLGTPAPPAPQVQNGVTLDDRHAAESAARQFAVSSSSGGVGNDGWPSTVTSVVEYVTDAATASRVLGSESNGVGATPVIVVVMAGDFTPPQGSPVTSSSAGTEAAIVYDPSTGQVTDLVVAGTGSIDVESLGPGTPIA